MKHTLILAVSLAMVMTAHGQNKNAIKAPDVKLGKLKSNALTTRKEILDNKVLKCDDPSYTVVGYTIGLKTKGHGDYVGDFVRKGSGLQEADLTLIRQHDSSTIYISGIVLMHNGKEEMGNHLILKYNN